MVDMREELTVFSSEENTEKIVTLFFKIFSNELNQ